MMIMGFKYLYYSPAHHLGNYIVCALFMFWLGGDSAMLLWLNLVQ